VKEMKYSTGCRACSLNLPDIKLPIQRHRNTEIINVTIETGWMPKISESCLTHPEINNDAANPVKPVSSQ
jgi:hypothetical protein